MIKHVYFQQCILLFATQKKYDADPILTFDQPLYQKVYEKQRKKSENNNLKRIVLRLDGLHICVNFLGSNSHFMSSSGHRQVLETIYGGDTVPHMLSDSAISRTSRVHLTVSSVLYATIVSDICECSLQDQFSAEEGEKDLFSNKLSKSKLGKVSQVLDQLKEQNILSEEVVNDIDVKYKETLSSIKKSFQKKELQSYDFSICGWLKLVACLSKYREHEILIFTYILSGECCRILLSLVIIYMLDRCTSTCRQCKILK